MTDTPEAIALNLSNLILKDEPNLTREKILASYRECLDLVKFGILPIDIIEGKKPKLTLVKNDD